VANINSDLSNIEPRQRDEIAALRAFYKPTAVHLNHVPNWFRLSLLRSFGCSRGDTSAFGLLHYVLGRAGWLDHCGSTVLHDGRVAFVSEPYSLSPLESLICDSLADELGCNYWPDANSWWFPGRTTRIVFAQSELNPVVRELIRQPRLCGERRRQLFAAHGYPVPRGRCGR